MLEIVVRVPTTRLKIRRSLAKLFQSYVYHQLDPQEHTGYKHPSGKVFKAMNFKIAYVKDMIFIKFSALDKENEKKVAMVILSNGLKLGEIHIPQTEISLTDRHTHPSGTITVKGFIAAAIKDGTSKQKIYLEPKTHKFQEIIRNHTLQKYEAFFGESYTGDLSITLLLQQPKPRTFFYDKAPIKAWYGVYEIQADEKMTGLILDTGIGAHAMQGLGFVEVVGDDRSNRKDSSNG